MQFQLQKAPESDARRRKGLALSGGLHVVLMLFLALNPDFLSLTPRRVVRVNGEDYQRDRFEVLDLYVPPDLAPEPPPQVAQVTPPDSIVPPAFEEAAPPPPPPPPPEPEPELLPPPSVIGPDDVIAEGARPDAPLEASEADLAEPSLPAPAEDVVLDAATLDPGDTGEAGEPGEGEGGEGRDAGNGDDVESREASEPLPEPLLPAVSEPNPAPLTLPSIRSQAESIIDEALARGPARGSGPGDQGSESPNLTTEEPTILSDTRGYDFGPYMNQVINRVRRNWYTLIPEIARIGAERGRVVIVFTITESGRVEDLRTAADSGSPPLDRAAVAAIQISNPFDALPADFSGDRLVLQFTFLYNMTPESTSNSR